MASCWTARLANPLNSTVEAIADPIPVKKALVIVGAAVALVAIAAVVFRDALQFTLMATMMQPAESFANTELPPAPDYADPSHWAALPERQDLADVTPSEAIRDNQAEAEVDVFFIHSNTYSANLGAVNYGFSEDDELPSEIIEPGVADAQRINGDLIVSEVRSEHYPAFMSEEGNYHIDDLNLFHMNLRTNAEARTQAFLRAQAAAFDPIDQG